MSAWKWLVVIGVIWLVGIGSHPLACAESTPVTIAVDLRDLQKRDFQRFQGLLLFRKLLVRLTQAGFAVVGIQLPSQVRVSLKAKGDQLLVEVKGPFSLSVKNLSRTQDGSIEQFHLEVIHKVLGASRQARWKWLQKKPSPRRKVVPPPKVKKIAKAPLRTILPSRNKNSWVFELGVGAMALYRIQGIDFLIRVDGRWGQKKGIGLYSSLFFSPSVAGSLTIAEWGLQVGPTWRQPLARSFFLELGFVVGFANHIFFFEQGLNDRGVRWDFLGNLLVMGNWQINPAVGLRIWLSAGLTQQSRVHFRKELIIWERSFLRFEAGSSLYFRF